MKLAPKQLSCCRRAHKRINILEGSVRSGKTIASLDRWARYAAVDGPPGILLMVGKTERTLHRNVLVPLQERFGRANVQIHLGRGEATIFGRTVLLMGANDESAEPRLRGITLAGAYVDEVTVIPKSFFQQLLARLSVKGAKLFGTTNPDSPYHWLNTDYLLRADELDLARFHFDLEDNTSLDPAYVAALKLEYTGLWYLRFIRGLWVAAEGAIFDQFNPDVGGPHVVDDLPDERTVGRWWVAVDYGTANPFHALLFAETIDGTVYVWGEWRWDSKAKQRQLTDSQYRLELTKWLKRELPPGGKADRLIVDPSAASFITELVSHNLPAIGAENDVLDGIRYVSALLGRHRVKLHRSCTHLIAELSGYVWDTKKQERGEDSPVKRDDHGVDAFRYGLYTGHRFGMPGAGAAAW